jgi:hypothetical protein
MNPALPSTHIFCIIPRQGLLTDVTDSSNTIVGYCVVFGNLAKGITWMKRTQIDPIVFMVEWLGVSAERLRPSSAVCIYVCMCVCMYVNMQIYSASAALKLEVQQSRFSLQYYTQNLRLSYTIIFPILYHVLISQKTMRAVKFIAQNISHSIYIAASNRADGTSVTLVFLCFERRNRIRSNFDGICEST